MSGTSSGLPRALLLLGPTGSGKTPLGEVAEKRGIAGRPCLHFDFGTLLRRTGSGRWPRPRLTGEEMDAVLRSLRTGALLEDRDFPVAEKILRAFLDERKPDPDMTVILNGLPRHVGQARSIDLILDIRTVVVLSCTAEVVRRRIGLDPGRDRAGRIDDSPAEIANKLAIFASRTLPLIEHYKDKGAALLRIKVGLRTRPEDMLSRLEAGTARARGRPDPGL